MFLKIDPSSGVPIYRQIMDQIKYSIANNALAAGDKLPSVRQLSLDLKVNPTTIVKAYSELEHERVIETRRGTLELPAWVDGRGKPPPGSLFIPFFDERLLANDLTLDAHCPISKEPDYKKCAARIRRAGGGKP